MGMMGITDELLRRVTPSALLALDGVIYSLNVAMAAALGKSAEQCVGHALRELLPESQRIAVDSLVAHGSTTMTVAMRVLEFPGPGGAHVVCLIEARPVEDPLVGRLVWVHSLDVENDLGSLLIPFRLAAKAADLGLCFYSSKDRRLEWLGGSPALASLLPQASVPLSWAIRRIHPDDRGALRRLLRPSAAESPWVSLRFRAVDEGWRLLACQSRRIQLGFGGPERIFGVLRDETRQETHLQRALAELSTQRQRADEIAAFSSALITAATTAELQQVVLTRITATFGALGGLLALVRDGHLRVSSDAGIAPRVVDALDDVPLSAQSPLPHAIRTGRPQFIPNHEEYIRRWPLGAALPWLRPDIGILITPISPKGCRPLGASVVVYGSEHRPSVDEQSLVSTLADMTGQALKRIETHQARMELATALQQMMLPMLPEDLPSLKIAARYQPSRDGLDIGGDWYDAFLTPDGAVTLEIGDAQGHDVDAAAVMGQVRASLRAIAAHDADPTTVLTRTNELLVTLATTRFASCTVLHFDPQNGQIIGASAGHVPLVYAREDGSYGIRMLPGGPVLGVLPEADYPEAMFTLERGTALVMLTDGAVEAPMLTMDAGLEQAGRLTAEALRQGLDADEIADRLLNTAVAADHLDDVAILVIQRI